MKGKLIKDHEGWWVQHHVEGLDGIDYTGETELHPNDVKQIEEDAKVFDNIEARIAAYPDVEFDIVPYIDKCEGLTIDDRCFMDTPAFRCGCVKSVAKLISFKDKQKQLIIEIMNEDAKDGLYDTVNDTVNDIDKLAEQEFPLTQVNRGSMWMPHSFDINQSYRQEGFFVGYKKAQETLYTEEQVRKAIDMAREKEDHEYYAKPMLKYSPNKIIQSLKQSKTK